jgi:hypothetical protein
MAPGLYGARFLKYLKMILKSFKKIKIKFLHTDNNKIY